MSMWKSCFAGFLAATSASSLKLASNGQFEQITTFILYAIFVLSNVLMWSMQLNSMANSETTINPILLFTSANFISTGIFGWTLHGETHDLPWFLGLILILIGTFIVQSSAVKRVKTE